MSHAGRHAAPLLTMTPRGTTRWATASIGVSLVLLLVGCGSDDDTGDEAEDAVSSTAATSSATTTENPEDPEAGERQTVIDAYKAASDAAIAASAPPMPDPNAPALLETHTGPMLKQRQDTFRALLANGWAIRYPPDSKYRVEVDSVEFEGDDIAILDVCVVDDGERIVVATGEVITSGLGTVEWTAAMRRVDGSWRLAERREKNRWDGEAGCAGE